MCNMRASTLVSRKSSKQATGMHVSMMCILSGCWEQTVRERISSISVTSLTKRGLGSLKFCCATRRAVDRMIVGDLVVGA